MSTNQPGGPLRKDPMAGTPDGFHTAARAALRQRDRDRLHNIARPTERAAAEARLHLALGRALADVQAADWEEIARLKRELADARRGAKAFAKDVAEAGEQLAACQADYEKRIADLAAELEQARHTITELQGQAATHECMPLPQRQKGAPEPNPDPPAPAGMGLDGSESNADATKGAARSPGKARASRGRRNAPGGAA